MSDLLSQNLVTAQTNQQPLPPTVASATLLAPTTRLTFVTGTVQLANLTPPTTGYCEVLLCFTDANPGAFATTGNLKTAYTPIQNRPILMCYDPSSNKWWAAAVV